jgi:hypothetical protein
LFLVGVVMELLPVDQSLLISRQPKACGRVWQGWT